MFVNCAFGRLYAKIKQMKIKSLTLSNYRNYEKQTFTLADGLNVFVGKNAQGKTNALEAIYFCAIGKSMRTNKDKDLISFDKDTARISLECQKTFGKVNIDVFLTKKDKKTIKINQLPIRRIGELFGEFNAVFFSPDELKLIKDTPEDRRRFMDIDISQTNKAYFYLLTKYEKILSSRNKLLKDSRSEQECRQTISIWDEQLATVASKIILKRIEFLNMLTPYAQKTHAYLTDSKEQLFLEYAGIVAEDEQSLKQLLTKKLADNFDKDFALGYTTIGPHRDDIKIKLNNIDVRMFGSQGQQRTCALSLKLAELEIMRLATGEVPVLLLDDVLSELDNSRKKKLLAFAKNFQTILTCTEFDYQDIPHKRFVIKNGKIT